ncbi:MAG: hypothetical protein WCF30_00630 [Terracidiphilus sp.]
MPGWKLVAFLLPGFRRLDSSILIEGAAFGLLFDFFFVVITHPCFRIQVAWITSIQIWKSTQGWKTQINQPRADRAMEGEKFARHTAARWTQTPDRGSVEEKAKENHASILAQRVGGTTRCAPDRRAASETPVFAAATGDHAARI